MRAPLRRFSAIVRGSLQSNLIEAGLHGSGEAIRARRLLLGYSYLSSIVANLIAGTFLTGFWLSFGADGNRISQLLMLGTFINLLQIAGPFLFDRSRNVKKLIVAMRATQHIINLILASLTALSGMNDSTIIRIQLVLAALSYLLGALAAPAIQRWHIKIVPENYRLGFFSVLHVTNSWVVYIVLFVAGLYTDSVSALVGKRLTFVLLRFFLFIIAVLEMYLLSRIEDPPDDLDINPAGRYRLADLPRALRQAPKYGLTMMAACLWAFSANLPGQYMVVYLIEGLGFQYSLITLVGLTNLAVILLFTPTWRRIITRLSWMRAFAFSMVLYTIPVVLIGLVHPGSLGLILYITGSLLAFLFGLGVNLSYANLIYVNMPPVRRTLYIAWFNTAYNCSALIGLWLGKRLYGLFSSAQAGAAAVRLQPAQWVQMCAAFLILLGGIVAWQASRIAGQHRRGREPKIRNWYNQPRKMRKRKTL